MTEYYSISYFRTNINKLTKKASDGYMRVANEICNDFNGKTINEIRNNRDMILNEDKFTIIKLRLPDTQKHLSKSNGYRLIYHVHKEKEEVTFLYIYPKRGPMSINNINDEFMKELLVTFLNEAKENSLIRHDIENELSEIEVRLEKEKAAV